MSELGGPPNPRTGAGGSVFRHFGFPEHSRRVPILPPAKDPPLPVVHTAGVCRSRSRLNEKHFADLGGHQVGGVSRSPDGLFAQQERGPIRGRPAVRGKRTYGGRPGQRVEKQGTWASRTQKRSEAGYGRPVDRGAWTTKTVTRHRQQPAHPQSSINTPIIGRR